MSVQAWALCWVLAWGEGVRAMHQVEDTNLRTRKADKMRTQITRRPEMPRQGSSISKEGKTEGIVGLPGGSDIQTGFEGD